MFPSVGLDQQTRLAVAILKWPLIFLLYLASCRWKPIPTLCYLTLFMGIGALCYLRDLQRESRSLDHFRGDALFYRYGKQVASATGVIPVKPEWSIEETRSFAGSLRLKLAERLRQHLPGDAVQVLDTVVICETNRSVSKEFARVWATTDLGSLVVHFLHFADFGRSMTLHYRSFVRGTHTALDVLKFVLATPLSFWFWIWPWSVNTYSIINHLSHFYESSYDDIDLQTAYTTSHYLLLNGLREILEEEGVLTEELRQMIFNQITNNNIRDLRISDSTGVNVGTVTQTLSAPSPRAA